MMGGQRSGGHNRKPTALKVIQGTARPDRLRDDTLKPRPIVGNPPRGIDPAARRLWRRLAPHLQKLGLLTELDAEMFEMLCEAWARWQHARRQLREIRETIRGGQGPISGDDLLKIRRAEMSFSAAEGAFKGWAREFGLSPLMRGRLVITEDEDAAEAEFEDYLARKQR